MRQEGHTSDMIFPVSKLLAYISTYFTLEEGDVVLTGTPAGVGPVAEGDVVSGGIRGVIEMEFPVTSWS